MNKKYKLVIGIIVLVIVSIIVKVVNTKILNISNNIILEQENNIKISLEQENNNINEIEYNEEYTGDKKINNIEEYIEQIYLFYKEIPVFKSIEDADLEWLYSIVYYPRPEEMTIEQINDAVKEMFGNSVRELNEKELNKIGFYLDEDGEVVYRDAIWDSDETFYEYKIKNTKKNNDIYEVEIVELICVGEYNSKKGEFKYYLKDLNEKTLAVIDGDNEFNIEKISEVFDKNISKMESKILKIKYEEETNQYHIISCEKISLFK